MSGPRLPQPTGHAGPLGATSVLAIGAIALALSQRPDTTVSNPSATSNAPIVVGGSDSDSDVEPGLKLLSECLNVSVATSTSAVLASRSDLTIRGILATVPDPLDSHLALAFDRFLVTIQRAFERDGYTLDRWFLPWLHPTHTFTQVSVGTLGDFLRSESKDSAPAQKTSPGVLLFRQDTSSDASRTSRTSLYLIYLVGETPTGGVQRQALAAAIKGLSALCIDSATQPGTIPPLPQPLRVLGPSFSGSVPSLRDGLLADARQPLRVVSGSATSASNPKTFLGLRSSFAVTTVDDNTLLLEFGRYVKTHLQLCPHEVGVLTEGGTAYGFTVSEAARNPLAGDLPGNDKGAPFIGYSAPFPPNVARVRAAYEVDQALRRPPRSGKRHSLELSIEAPSSPKDLPPLLSPRTSANSDEVLLDQTLEVVRRRQIRLLGLIASDPRDVMFLARKAREAGIDAVLFTLSADVLFLHPDAADEMRGMLVVSPYPLLADSLFLNSRDQVSLSFPSTSDEGTYNALRCLLSTDERLDIPCANASHLSAYTSSRVFAGAVQRQSIGPPVWITAIAGGRFLPVLEAAQTPVKASPLDTTPIVRTSRLVPLAVTSLALSLLVLVLSVAALQIRPHSGAP